MGISFTEEPYDGPTATVLVRALLDDLNERYKDIDLAERPAHQQAQDDADYLTEVTAAELCRPQGVFVVAWLDGEPAGCGAVRPDHELAGTAEVKRMYTTPAGRGRGVGRAILQHLEAVAHELGYRQLRLETGTAQPEAMALYESNGWARIESFGRFAGHSASVCYGKDLRTP